MAELVRFGVAIEDTLLEQIDALVKLRGVTRSELLRDLARAEVTRAKIAQGVPAVASLTLVYDHHVRDLTERLTALQHELGEQVISSLHVHLDAARCLEVIIMRGRSDELSRIADRLLGIRGVTHGGVRIVEVAKSGAARKSPTSRDAHTHDDAPHDHAHDDVGKSPKRSKPRSRTRA